MSYRMTEQELKQLKRLQDKKRTLAKKEAAFWKQVDERRDEILAHFNLFSPVHSEGGQSVSAETMTAGYGQ